MGRNTGFVLILLGLMVFFINPRNSMADDDALRIVAYEIIGSHNISDEVILLSIESRVGDIYTKELVQRDVAALRKLGYFLYVSADAVPFKDGLKVILKVHENPVIKSIEIKGNTIIPTEKIREVIKLETGVTLNLPQMKAAILKINKLYQEAGYTYCGILSQDQIEIDEKTNSLVIHIAEPKLRNTTITGAAKTKNYVILRQLEIKRGQLIKTSKMRRSLRNIFNLQYFEDVKPPRPRLSEDKEFIDLDITVKEQKTGQASFGGGYSSVNGAIGFVDIAETNLGGRGQTLRAKLQFGGEQRYQLDFLEPWFKGRPQSVGISIFDMAYEREEFEDGDVLSRFEEGRLGFSLKTGWRVAKDTRLNLRFTHELINVKAVENPDTGLYELPPDLQDLDEDGNNKVDYRQQTIRLTWSKDARDNFLNATEGYRLSLSASTTGGFLEGINGFQQYRLDWRRYHKNRLLGKHTVFAYRLKGGVTHMTQGTLRFIDRFTVGGGETLRGWEDHEFTGDTFGMLNLELRKSLAKMIGFTLFYDIGDAWGMDGHDTFEARRSYGFGLRLNTPIGPFRLDWGKAQDRTSRFHFGIGQQF